MTSFQVPKAQLLVILEGHEFRVTLEGATTSIGSDPDCKLSLTAPGVEPRHCIVQRSETGFEVFDLFSETGTRLNGRPTEANVLRTGDQITIGSVRIVYLETGPTSAPRPTDEPEQTPMTAPLAADPWDTWQDSPFFDSDQASSPATADQAPPSRAILPLAPEPPPLTQPPASPTEPAAEPPESGWRRRLRAWQEERVARRVERDERRTREQAVALSAAAAAAAPTPATEDHRRTMAEISAEATRFKEQTFNEAFVEQLRSSPYVVVSVIMHVCLAIILHSVTTETRVVRERPPVEAGLDFTDLLRPDEIESDMPAEIDPQVDEIVDEPDDVEAVEPEEMIQPNEEFDQDIPDTARGDAEGPPMDAFTSGLASGGLGENLSGIGGINAGGKKFRKYVRSLRASGLDIVIVIDSTGSMERVINEARKQVGRMISTVGGLIPNFRLGVVTYRDEGDDYVTRDLHLTPYYYEAVDFLDSLEADQGGDIPEAVLDGMKAAVGGMKWSSRAKRVVILIGDAQPHKQDMGRLKQLVASFAKRNGSVHTLVTSGSGFGARRADPDAIRTFSSIAEAGAGVTGTLKESAAVVRRIVEVAFGATHKEDVQAAMNTAESGWRSRHFRKMVKEKDLQGVLKAMLKARPSQLLFRHLTTENDRVFLPAYLAVLEDERASMQARWAATVLTKRLARSSRDRRFREAARALHPRGSKSAVARRVNAVKRAARAADYPTALPGR